MGDLRARVNSEEMEQRPWKAQVDKGVDCLFRRSMRGLNGEVVVVSI